MSASRTAVRPRVEEFEPRILYSADLGAALLDGVQWTQNVPYAEQRTLDAAGEFAALLQGAGCCLSVLQRTPHAMRVAA